MNEEPRRLSRNETHDLSMIIKDRAKVLKAHAEEQAAACMADFETKMATIYTWDQDETWKKATEEAMKVGPGQPKVHCRPLQGVGYPGGVRATAQRVMGGAW